MGLFPHLPTLAGTRHLVARRGAGWFQLILMLLALTMGLLAIASPVIGG